ncbi:MAG: hypothetical protein IPN03_10310 [Holophagales bacterium]|nr:hypothetical protein [Holophagales bacterium]
MTTFPEALPRASAWALVTVAGAAALAWNVHRAFAAVLVPGFLFTLPLASLGIIDSRGTAILVNGLGSWVAYSVLFALVIRHRSKTSEPDEPHE